MDPISRPPRILRALFNFFLGEAIFRIPHPKNGIKDCEPEKHLYLTFDDGPHPEITPWVLEQLEKEDVCATFFMVGDNARRYPHLVKRILSAGHSVGNHTMHHLQGIKTEPGKYLGDIAEAARYIPSRLFRPPHGNLTRTEYKKIKEAYTIVMFDMITRDYSNRMDPEKILHNIHKYVRDGSVVVFHDSQKAWPRLEAMLPQALKMLKAEGFKFETIPPTGL